MKSSTVQFLETAFSVLAIAAITLAIATTAFHLFNPDDGLISRMNHEWNLHPIMLALLGGSVFVMKFWLQGVQSARIANLMFYGALVLGLYYGFKLFID